MVDRSQAVIVTPDYRIFSWRADNTPAVQYFVGAGDALMAFYQDEALRWVEPEPRFYLTPAETVAPV
jgi:hypothetical protein